MVEYSTDGGASWSRMTNAMLEAGEGYVDNLETALNGNTNVLAGQEAFGNRHVRRGGGTLLAGVTVGPVGAYPLPRDVGLEFPERPAGG
ncbi:MAG: hypothetical protein HND48_18810 [Chloroflexi bacterium]|nr:hypothetical protein [Chloroflexota bacterium]